MFWDIILGRQFRDFGEGLVNPRKQNVQALLSVLGFLCNQTRNRKRGGTAVSWGYDLRSIGQKREQLRYNLAEKLLVRWSDPVEAITFTGSPEIKPKEGWFVLLSRNSRAYQEKRRSLTPRSLHQTGRRTVHGFRPI